jgi:hypothetical protein
MNGDALSQTVDSNLNGWRKPRALDAPGGMYAAVTEHSECLVGPLAGTRVFVGLEKTQIYNQLYCL